MPLSDAQVDRVLAILKSGQAVTISVAGGRYISTWTWTGTQWHLDAVDEGSRYQLNPTEDALRRDLAAQPEAAFAAYFSKAEPEQS